MAEPVHVPEVIEPDEKLPADLVALRNFATVMDEAFRVPGTNIRVGLDPLIGLIPGIGDVISAILSLWIVVGALRHRVPLRKILRMMANILIDLFVGEIPILGDLFDFAFEENVMNMRILMQYRNRRLPPRTLGQIAGSLFLVFLSMFVASILALAGVIALVLWVTAQRNS